VLPDAASGQGPILCQSYTMLRKKAIFLSEYEIEGLIYLETMFIELIDQTFNIFHVDG